MMEAKKEMVVKKEFKINEFITLRLQWNKQIKRWQTVIYIGGEVFRQCKYLLMVLPEKGFNYEIDSIDDAEKFLSGKLEITPEDFNLTDEEMFWGHCSNLQAWVEYDYDTRLLHSNLSFSLLKKLVNIGDLKARKIYKDEVTYRYSMGDEGIRSHLYEGNFLDDFTLEEIAQLSIPEKQYLGLKQISEETGELFQNIFNVRATFGGKVWKITLSGLDSFPRGLLKLKDTLKWLIIQLKDGVQVPDWIGKLSALEKLVIKGNFTSLPESIGNLKNLWSLTPSGNLISLPESIGNLKNLSHLILSGNQMTKLPKSIRNLTKLVDLTLEKNRFERIPKEILELKKLQVLGLRNNPLVELPEWLIDLKSTRISID